MSCIDNYHYDILYKGSFKECAQYIKNNYKNIRDLKAGEEVIEGVMLIGKPPIPVAYHDDYIIFPYTKPCYGTYVLRVPLNEYIKSHKEENNKKDDKKDKKSNSDSGSVKNILSKLKFW